MSSWTACRFHTPSFPCPSHILYISFLDNPTPGKFPGDIGKHEGWWVERQEALEQAGYMLRPRLRPGWQPSWTGSKKPFLDFEDAQRIRVSTFSLTTCAFVYDIRRA